MIDTNNELLHQVTCIAREYRDGILDDTLMVREMTAALSARASAGEGGESEVDELIRALGFDPERFRTEAGFINHYKLRAAIKNPQDYEGLMLHTTPGQWVPIKPEGAPYWGIHTATGETVAGTSSGLSEGDARLICELHNAATPQPAQAGAVVLVPRKHGPALPLRGKLVRDRGETWGHVEPEAAPQPQEVQRPSADWYRRKIMQGDGVEAMAGPLPPFHVCSNPSARHRHGADPMGHCPDCVAQGLGNWSCTPESPTPPAHGEGEVWIDRTDLADIQSGRRYKAVVFAEAFDGDCIPLTTRPTPEAQEARDAVRSKGVPGYGGVPIDFDDPELQQW